MSRMRLPVLGPVLALAGVLVLGACASEAPVVVDDGAQVVPLAGLGPQVESAGVDVVAADVPADATADDVESALGDAGLATPVVTRVADVADNTFAFDPAQAAGLTAVVTDAPGTAVVLVFAAPSAAAVFAASDPDVFTDASADDGRTSLLSGNLVAYASARSAKVRRALEALGGATPVPSPSESSSASPSETATS